MNLNKNSLFNKSPFSKKYWKSALEEATKIKSIAFVSILIAIRIAIGSVYVPVANNVRVYFTFIVVALIGFMFGPIMGLISGFIGDIIGFVLFPSGAFFIGYTISAMLSGLIFGLFLYKTRITVLKIFIAKFLINLIVNASLGTIWRMIIVKDITYEFFITDFSVRFLKNLILLPIEVYILVLMFNLIIPILKTRNFLTFDVYDHVTLF